MTLQNANTQTRDLVWTGWSMFYPFTRPEIAPYFVTDEASGQGDHEILESSLLGETNLNSTLPDFWRVSLDGKVSLIRAYREDRTAYPELGLEPGEWFRPFFVLREVAELVRHARALCENFLSARSVAFRCAWFGLQGRRIADPEAHWSKKRVAKAGRRICAGEWPVAELLRGGRQSSPKFRPAWCASLILNLRSPKSGCAKKPRSSALSDLAVLPHPRARPGDQ